ncbi:MAG: hypothetical protein H7Z42_08665, partial [Roseiflexaceae bacterium]|nr:hypothetical protein [Roseiflexaceae bacterium]
LQPGGQLLQPGGQLLQPGGQLLQPGGQLLQSGGQLLQPGGQLLQSGGQPAYRGSWLRWGVMVALALVVASHAWTSAHYLDALRLTGGLSFHSSAIGDVSRFLAARPEPIVALDWGLAAQVEYFTDGQKRVDEYFGFTPEPPADYAAQLRARFGRGELFLLHAANQEAFPRRQAFLDAVEAAGLRAETVNVSIRRDGWPMIEVWRVHP